MSKKQKKVAGLILLALALVLMYFTIVDFDWKIWAYQYLFLLGYIMTGTGATVLLMDATGNLPDFTITEEE